MRYNWLPRAARPIWSHLSVRIKPYLKHRHEIGRFVVCGAVNAVLTYGIYVTFVAFLSYRISYTISFVSGIAFSYYVNARFVFLTKMDPLKAVLYLLVYLTQYLVGLGCLFLLIDVARLNKLFAPLLTLLITVPLTFIAARYVMRRSPARPRD